MSTEEKAKVGEEKGLTGSKGTPEEEAEKARKKKEEEDKKPAASG